MLAATTTDSLSIADPTLLKKASCSVASCLDLIDRPVSSSWSPDNAFLNICSSNTIYRYDPATNSIKNIYSTQEPEAISCLVSKDKGSLIFNEGSKINVLECVGTPNISQTFDSHKSTVTSLSLSNDNTLLASTSETAAHVHNLSLGSHTALRGLNLGGQPITTCTFHPHSRTRLLLAVGKQILIYDTTRPSGPLKTIALTESASSGDIIALACSPFSKTLAAAATSAGFVGLLDLEKDKALFRVLNVKVPLTSIGFSPEGAAIFLGTENGKLLVIDLRSLDKPPKSIAVSDSGNRIETISVQKKVKSTGEATPKAPATTAKLPTEPLPVIRRVSAATNKAVASPARVRLATKASPAATRRIAPSLKDGHMNKSPLAKATTSKKSFSPIRDSHPNSNSSGDISVQLETLETLRPKTKVSPKPLRSSLSPKAPISAPSTAQAKEATTSRRTRTVPTATRTRKTSTSDATSAGLAVPSPGRTRPRTASSASRTGSGPATSNFDAPANAIPRPSSSVSRTSAPRESSRTPSPELPDMKLDPITPLKRTKQRSTATAVLGLSTPEVEKWAKAGRGVDRVKGNEKGKGKTVGFRDAAEDLGSEDKENDPLSKIVEKTDLAKQISPRRPMATSASGSGATAWAPSPLRQSTSHGPASSSSAHELLKSIVQDVMCDFQRQTKGEIEGLHLDLLRMGRGWKSELRSLMNEYVGDMSDLREENRRLREENERLRGY